MPDNEFDHLSDGQSGDGNFAVQPAGSTAVDELWAGLELDDMTSAPQAPIPAGSELLSSDGLATFEQTALEGQRDALTTEVAELSAQRDAVAAELEILKAEKTSLTAERDAVAAELAMLQGEQANLTVKLFPLAARHDAEQARLTEITREVERLNSEQENSKVTLAAITQLSSAMLQQVDTQYNYALSLSELSGQIACYFFDIYVNQLTTYIEQIRLLKAQKSRYETAVESIGLLARLTLSGDSLPSTAELLTIASVHSQFQQVIDGLTELINSLETAFSACAETALKYCDCSKMIAAARTKLLSGSVTAESPAEAVPSAAATPSQ